MTTKNTTKPRHTPGPWQVDDHRFVTASKDRAFATIAEVTPCESELDDETFYEISEKEAEANARLIAAAPELLDACNSSDTAFAMLSICDGLTSQARAAIREGWAKVQAATIKARPHSGYAESVQEEPMSALNLQKSIEGEMLDALREAIREVDGFEKRTGISQFCRWVTKARAAVARAEGRSA